ncbi:MAG: transporter [Fusobacteriaceae bacterium]|nr:transporter [Fusobacteriaceae bacterium]
MKKINLLLMGLFAFSMIASAQEQTEKNTKKQQISIPGALNTPNANTLPKGKLNLTLKTQIFDNNKMISGNSEVTNSENKNTVAFNNTLSLRYALTDKVTLKTNIPFISKEMHLTKTGASETTLENTGLGDIKVFMGYNLKSQNKGDKFSALLEFGANLPTGETDKEFSIKTKKGIITSKYPLGMQSGDGSLDAILQLTLSKVINKSRVDLSTAYTLNNEGDNNLENGDELSVDLAYVSALNEKISLIGEINGKYSNKNKVSGIEEENSGGTLIYITPGIHFKANNKFNVSGGIQVPVYKDLNGQQLISDYRLITKLVYNIK